MIKLENEYKFRDLYQLDNVEQPNESVYKEEKTMYEKKNQRQQRKLRTIIYLFVNEHT